MAFPTTIASTDIQSGAGGPFLSGGNVYVITKSSTSSSTLRAFKATDPSSSFSNVGTDFAVTSGNDIDQFAACIDGTNIHVVTFDKASGASTPCSLRYHVFSTSSDTWTTTNEAIKTAYDTSIATADQCTVDIAVRSDGDVIVVYNGAKEASMGSDYMRVKYARRESGVWTIDVAVDNGGTSNWGGANLVKGASDRVHFHFVNRSQADAYARALNSANSLQAFPASAHNTDVDLDAVCRGTAYSSSAIDRVTHVYAPAAGGSLEQLQYISDDAPNPLNLTGDITSAVSVTVTQHMASLAPDGPTVWCMFTDSNGDIYRMSRLQGSAWTNPTLFQAKDLTAINRVYTSIYTRNSNVVVGVLYADNGGGANKYTEYTISAGAAATRTGSMSATDVADRFSASGYTLIRGSLSATDVADKFTATGKTIIRGTFAATDTPDSFSASGTSYTAFRTGSMAATDAPDTFSASGYVLVRGALSATDAADKFTATGQTIVRGTFSATDSPDRFSASGGTRIRGTFSATDVPDHFTATGAVRVTGRLSATDVADSFTAAGYTLVRGTFSATDAQDRFSASGYALVRGTFSATDAPDRFSASAQTRITGTFSATDRADIFSASGTVRVTGTFTATDAADTLSASGYVKVSGALSATDRADIFSASGYTLVRGTFSATDRPDTFVAFSVPPSRTGSLSATDVPDTFAATGGTRIRGTFSATDTPDTFSASAYTLIRGSLSTTDRPDTFVATGAVRITGALSATDAPDTFSASAQTRITGTFSATDRPDTFSASGTVVALYVTGSLSATDAPDLFVATGRTIVRGTFSATDSPDRFSAAASLIALSVSAAEVVAPDPGAGGGGKRDDYIPASEDFWAAREKYLLSLQPEIQSEPSPEFSPEISVIDELAQPSPTLLLEFRFQREQIITALPAAQSLGELRSLGKKLIRTNRRIYEQKLLIARAEVAALRQQIAARRAIRRRRIARKRKLLATLELAHSLTNLYTQ